MVYAFSLWFLRRFLGAYMPARVSGTVPSGGVILAGNHPTILDGLVVGTYTPRKVRFLVFADMLRIPVLGWWLRALGFLPAGCLDEAVACLERGECVAIFPEGTNTHSYELREFRRGVAVLAVRSGCPVVPFGLRGTEELCPGDAAFVRGGPLALSFGSPLWLSEVSAEPVRTAVASQLRSLSAPAGHSCAWLGWFVKPLTWLLLALADRAGFKGRR